MYPHQKLIEWAAAQFGVSAKDVVSGVHTKAVSACRRRCITILRANTTLSWLEIGKLLGYKGKPPGKPARVRQ